MTRAEQKALRLSNMMMIRQDIVAFISQICCYRDYDLLDCTLSPKFGPNRYYQRNAYQSVSDNITRKTAKRSKPKRREAQQKGRERRRGKQRDR